jgi:Common central domain of tyrosinase.
MTYTISNQSNNNNTSITEQSINSNLSKIPFAISNLTSESQSFVTEPLTDCSVTIEGGGQRPDPAVDGYGNNTTPLDPPDDGIDMNDTSTYHHRINVGELVKLEVKLDGIPLESVQNIRWTIAEPKIKNYDESIPGKFVTYNLKDQDYLKPAISFYWKDDGDKEVSVSVEGISNNQSKKCDATRTFTVERNYDDINRQAEDFYVFNHNATVLDKHLNWHVTNQIDRPCDPSNNGEKFFLFHKRVISNFDAWRETFGYPKIIVWDPATNPPNSKAFYDQYRDPIYRPQPIPSYYTTEGGNTSSACALAHKLSDYKSADSLASEFEITWHGEVHYAVGGNFGDMNNFGLAPKDPVFWMWHKNIDSVYDKYREIKDQE